jgi:hypothetical protein
MHYALIQVGSLCEMDIDDDRLAKSVQEEGKCLLGYNTNAGSSIHLRLRTDERTAFRPYNSLINTLLHELAHNVFGPHNTQFWALFAELKARYLIFHGRASVSRPSLQKSADIAVEEMEDIEAAVLQEVLVDRQAPMNAMEQQVIITIVITHTAGNNTLLILPSTAPQGLLIAYSHPQRLKVY